MGYLLLLLIIFVLLQHVFKKNELNNRPSANSDIELSMCVFELGVDADSSMEAACRSNGLLHTE